MKLLKIFSSRHFLPILVVLFFGILASRTLLFEQGYFNMHDDLQIMRQVEMEKCIHEGQIPCRWVPDMGYGYGFPLFNFYPPLPFITGEIYRLRGVSFVDTAKLLFATAIILSGLFMYLFAKEYFGKVGGIVSAIFYIWAPYHAVDVYVRGAMNESWALIFFPMICWATYRLINNKQKAISTQERMLDQVQHNVGHDLKWIIVLAIAYFGLFTSHNLMLMIFTPVFAVWVLITLWQHDAWEKIPSLIIAGLWSVGLAAFFTFPAILENKYTQLAGQLIGYYDYTVHFASIRQILFSTFWGYGPSVWLEEDGMAFQIGYPLWILSLVVGVLLIVQLFYMVKRHPEFSSGSASNTGSGIRRMLNQVQHDGILLPSFFFLLAGWFAAFMVHSKSTFIWTAIKQLGYLQFPWRFLTLVIFSFSFVVGAIPGLIAHVKEKSGWFAKITLTYPQMALSFALIVSIVAYSWSYFLPEHEHMGSLTDEEKLTGKAWSLQQTAGIYDYLPATAKTAPKAPQAVLAEVVDGDGAISGTDQGTYWGMFATQVNTEKALVRINIFDFPGWKIYMDGKELTHFIPDEEEWGRMYIVVPEGKHQIYTQIFNTPVRTWSNIISFVSWGALVGLLFFYRRNAER